MVVDTLKAVTVPANFQVMLDIHDEVELLLQTWRDGDAAALDELLPLVFEHLRRIAHAQRMRVGGGETMRTTALIHETYLKLRRSGHFQAVSKQHFLNIAARVMRQILVDYARSRLAARRRDEDTGGAGVADEQWHALRRHANDLIDLDAALNRIEPTQPRLVEIILCRCFAGYTDVEIADLLGVSERTVRRDWLKAKAWLIEELDGTERAG